MLTIALSLILAFGIGFFVWWLLSESKVGSKQSRIDLARVKDFERLAQSRVPEAYWSYLSCGSGEGLTLKENVAAYDRYLIRPRYLRDVSDVDMRVTLFGDEMNFPIGTSPTIPHSFSGELNTSKACNELGVWMILSSLSNLKMEEAAKNLQNRGHIWYSMNAGMNIELYEQHVRRAQQSGFRALVITIDCPVAAQSKLHHGIKQTMINRFFPNFDVYLADANATIKFFHMNLLNPSTKWDKIDKIRSLTHLPIILKGIMTSEDAREAVKHDIQGIIVSNHGGRQLDGVPATIDVLSEVVSAVESKVDVFIDGGIRKGTDVFKALALGAKAVFVGRPAVWGLEYNGLEGVKSVLTILRDELKLAMQLSGCASLSDIRKSNVVVHESHYRGYHGRH